MDLDEAINHCEEKAKEKRDESERIWKAYSIYPSSDDALGYDDCIACAEEHEQLAEWLTQLKRIKEAFKTGEVMNLVAECMSIWGE